MLELQRGGADGKSVTYLMRNAFLLFSVRSMIEKASEQSRIFELELEKKAPSEAAPSSGGMTNWPPSSRRGTWGANTSPASCTMRQPSAATLKP